MQTQHFNTLARSRTSSALSSFAARGILAWLTALPGVSSAVGVRIVPLPHPIPDLFL